MATDAKNLFQAESYNLLQILSEPNVGYYIPPYQRPYRWSSEKVDNLIEDIFLGFNKLLEQDDSFTFLGTVITFNDTDNVTVHPQVQGDLPAKVLNLVDGQQRLTTLLIMCICLHDHIRCYQDKFKPKIETAEGTTLEAFKWLDVRVTDLLGQLKSTFMFDKGRGDKPSYPRMIRAFHDCWSADIQQARYITPVARLTDSYITHLNNHSRILFNPQANSGAASSDGEQDLYSRYKELKALFVKVYKLKIPVDIGDLPKVTDIIGDRDFQQALFGFAFPVSVSEALRTGSYLEDEGLFQLLILATYILKRVAITVVEGKNEDYAFNVFESLNTTGEPLTAFETFTPRVVSAVTLSNYEASNARGYIDQVSEYLKKFEAGIPLQDGTRDLIINFALNETGEKISKRLSDQRKHLQDQFSRYLTSPGDRDDFLKNMRDLAIFTQYSWVPASSSQPILHGLPVDASSNTLKLCLAFLQKMGHTITIPLICRFYSEALNASSDPTTAAQTLSDLDKAIKAIVAFSVLWRASRKGTDNIDQEYRQIMTGFGSLEKIPGFSRRLSIKLTKNKSEQSSLLASGNPIPDGQTLILDPNVSVQNLKKELRARLLSPVHGEIKDKDDWIEKSSNIPAYTNNKTVARFLLLAAHHDAVEDPQNNGLIIKGRAGISQCLTYESWVDENTLSLEHIAPDNPGTSDWPNAIYDDTILKHSIGNLVLVQSEANSSLSNRPWSQKSILYKALGASTQEESRRILDFAEADGINFATSTAELISLSSYMPQLVALGAYGVDGEGVWSELKIKDRSKRILGLAWDALYPWLED
jgi:hypothetical protein